MAEGFGATVRGRVLAAGEGGLVVAAAPGGGVAITTLRVSLVDPHGRSANTGTPLSWHTNTAR